MVKRHPVAVGSGVPLFDGAFQPFRFQLAGSLTCALFASVMTGSRISPSGVLFLTYASGGS